MFSRKISQLADFDCNHSFDFFFLFRRLFSSLTYVSLKNRSEEQIQFEKAIKRFFYTSIPIHIIPWTNLSSLIIVCMYYDMHTVPNTVRYIAEDLTPFDLSAEESGDVNNNSENKNKNRRHSRASSPTPGEVTKALDGSFPVQGGLISIDALAPISTIKAKARRIRAEQQHQQKLRADRAFDTKESQQQQQLRGKGRSKNGSNGSREHRSSNTFDVNLRRYERKSSLKLQ